MRIDYIVIWDGRRNGPGGALLSPPAIPEPVTLRYPTVMPIVEPVPAQRPAVVVARLRRNFGGGPVARARDAIWQMLVNPVTVRDVATALSLASPPLQSAFQVLRIAGLIVWAGSRHNTDRRVGMQRESDLWVRHPGYRECLTQPCVHLSQAQRRPGLAVPTGTA